MEMDVDGADTLYTLMIEYDDCNSDDVIVVMVMLGNLLATTLRCNLVPSKV